MKRAHGAQKLVLHVTVGGSTTDEKNPGQIPAEGSATLATVGGPTTEEKNPGQSSAEDSALFITVGGGPTTDEKKSWPTISGDLNVDSFSGLYFCG